MNFVWATCRKDWRRRWRDPAGMLMSIGIPLLVGAVLSLLAGGRGGPKPQAHVLVVDEDDSFLSGLLVGALGQDQTGSPIRAEKTDATEGRRRVEEGKATALLVIPEGFGRAVLDETPTTLHLVTNPAQRILPAIVEETLGALGDVVFYLHRLLGDEMQAIADGPPDDDVTRTEAWVANVAVRIHRLVEDLQGTVFPPLIVLETGVPAAADTVAAADTLAAAGEAAGAEAEPEPGFALLFVPGLLFMSLLFLADGVAEDLWAEREARTLRRAFVTPRRPAALLAGKMLAGAGIMLVVAAIALAVGWGWFGLRWARYPGAVLWSTFSGAVLLALFATLHLHMPTRRGASVLGSALVFPLMMLGGSFFPFEAMPDWMVAVGRWTPNGWALSRLKELLVGTAEPAALLRSAAALVAVGAILFAVCARRLGATFARS